MISKLYFVTFVTKNNKIISGYHFGTSQQPEETEFEYLNLTQGEIAKRLFDTINNWNNDCEAIINFWEIKTEVIKI